MSELPRILFVCVENANRSQMAEAFARIHGKGQVEAVSAGSRPSGQINPRAIEAMRERNYDLTSHRSKGLEAVPTGPYAAVVTMGCGDACPWVAAARREDWALPDPRGMESGAFNKVRDDIEQRVRRLLAELQVGAVAPGG
jgi:protein-tyrosine-phosphatase